MPWLLLVIAGLLEVAWATGLPATAGFTRLWPSIGTVAALVGSIWLLSIAVRTLPMGTAYAVWVGIGATGAAVLGVLVYREPITIPRAAFLALLVVAIIGLRLTAPPDAEVSGRAVP
ncbi:MAG: multidrug efflux SMR transporter [Deltaproteobacteria bacterium]|nr:multidrug efflux SMR transporter [Nannocystaceae bacterium]